MARTKKETDLTLSQINRIRATQSRSISSILSRVRRNALGTLKDKDGKLIEMTAGQIKSAELIKACVLPQQQATTFEDVTEPELTWEEQEQRYQQAIQQLPVQDLKIVLASMPSEERQALVDSLEETSQ